LKTLLFIRLWQPPDLGLVKRFANRAPPIMRVMGRITCGFRRQQKIEDEGGAQIPGYSCLKSCCIFRPAVRISSASPVVEIRAS